MPQLDDGAVGGFTLTGCSDAVAPPLQRSDQRPESEVGDSAASITVTVAPGWILRHAPITPVAMAGDGHTAPAGTAVVLFGRPIDPDLRQSEASALAATVLERLSDTGRESALAHAAGFAGSWALLLLEPASGDGSAVVTVATDHLGTLPLWVHRGLAADSAPDAPSASTLQISSSRQHPDGRTGQTYAVPSGHCVVVDLTDRAGSDPGVRVMPSPVGADRRPVTDDASWAARLEANLASLSALGRPVVELGSDPTGHAALLALAAVGATPIEARSTVRPDRVSAAGQAATDLFAASQLAFRLGIRHRVVPVGGSPAAGEATEPIALIDPLIPEAGGGAGDGAADPAPDPWSLGVDAPLRLFNDPLLLRSSPLTPSPAAIADRVSRYLAQRDAPTDRSWGVRPRIADLRATSPDFRRIARTMMQR